jgi:UDP-N-acetylglucosamine 2-epimerase (non-hydrolysing)
MKKVFNIVGARPNFMKVAPIQKEMSLRDNLYKPILLHTGQHYDKKMSTLFFDDLNLPRPEIYLGVGSGSHAEQTAKIMIAFEKACLKHKPDLILVVGDVNSTIGCSLVASKLGIPVAHVEAGLRSFDRSMPEEVNRILTDTLSDFLFITERSGEINLLKEGKDSNKIHFVGNVMIDSLINFLEKASQSKVLEKFNLIPQDYLLITLHRPSNVDSRNTLLNIVKILEEIQKKIKIIFPVHPRTRNKLEEFNLYSSLTKLKKLILTDPVGYLDFLQLEKNSRFILTDSGGIQEETTYLGIPCLTLRENTERPITTEIGTNEIVGMDSDKILNSVETILAGEWKQGKIPPFWDGHAAERIIHILSN